MPEVTIEELCAAGALAVGDGYRTKRSEHGEPGYRILRVADVDNGSVRLDGPDFVRKDFLSAIGSKLSEAGDVLLTTKGTVGRVAIFPDVKERVAYSPQLCYFRVLDRRRLVPRYLAYWFQSEDFKRQASHRANNTDMAAYINLKDIRSLQLSLPSLGRQRAIAEVLGALDDKIAVNDRVIAAADELACVLYRSVADTGTPLSSLARFVNGRAFTKDPTGTGRVVVRIAELNSGIGASTVYNDLEVPDDNLTRPGDLLFAWSGSLTVARWYRPEAIVNQHIFKVIPNNGVPMWLVNQAVRAKLNEFKAVAADKATTMGHIQRRHLDQPVAIPAPGAIKELDGVMDALWQRALAGEVENLSLVRTRDELLRLLMSGRLCVKGPERTVEEVV